MVYETNNIRETQTDLKTKRRAVYWNADGLRVTRLRLISDPGYPMWDVSYCLGVTQQGEDVWVILPFSQLPKKNYKAAIIAHAKREHVYAKALRILDDDVLSLLC